MTLLEAAKAALGALDALEERSVPLMGAARMHDTSLLAEMVDASNAAEELRTAIAEEEAHINEHTPKGAPDELVGALQDSVHRNAGPVRAARTSKEYLEEGVHSCGYHCQRPACAIAQRDELRTRLVALEDEKNTYIDYVGDALGQSDIETLWDAAQRVLSERDELRAKLATMEAGEPVAWRTFDGEGGYDYRTYDDNEDYRDSYIKRNGEHYAHWVEPLYTHTALLPAYVPIPWMDLARMYEQHPDFEDCARAIEQATARRCGVVK